MNPINPNFLCHLKQIFTADCSSDPADCLAYSYDNSRISSQPDVVAFVTQPHQVAPTIQLCNHYNIPITARGRGTGTTGGSVPLQGGLALSFERMQRILEVDVNNRFLIAEPGATNQAIQQAASAYGLFWAPDPSSAAYSSIGGNLAHNSAGPRAIKYGTPRENTLGLRIVTGAGIEMRTGVYTSKTSVAYDLTRLIIGSEGTLALITEATLKLTPLAPGNHTLRALYLDIESASQAVIRIMSQPFTPCALELLDREAVQLVKAQINLPEKTQAMLIINIDGALSAMPEILASLEKAITIPGLLALEIAHNHQDRINLWAARRALSPALRQIAPCKINEDIVVPINAIAKLIFSLETLSKKYNIKIVSFGHAGNGNLHVNLLYDKHQQIQATACMEAIFDLSLNLRGSLSGEHGIGITKRDYISRELSTETLALMKAIKKQFDPKGILNPGKIFPY